MRTFLSRTGLLVTGIGLSVLLACESSQQARNPGALPTGASEVAPRLNASTYVAHGDLLERQGNLEQAVVQYRQALDLTPNLSAARSRLGITLNKLGRHDEATAEFREAVRRNPEAAHLHNNLGFSLYLEGKYAEAEKALAQAVKIQPTFRRAQLNRGVVLAKLGRYDDALAAFCLGGAEADAHYNLAVIQVDDGHYAAAARSLEQALTLNPELAAARQELKDIARLAAAEEEAERTAVAQTVPAKERIAVAPVVTATDDIQLAADAEAAPTPAPSATPPAPAEPPTPPAMAEPPAPEPSAITEPPVSAPSESIVAPVNDADPAALVLQEIEALLMLSAERPLDEAEVTQAYILVALFDEIAAQIPSNLPRNEESVCQMKDILGRLNQID